MSTASVANLLPEKHNPAAYRLPITTSVGMVHKTPSKEPFCLPGGLPYPFPIGGSVKPPIFAKKASAAPSTPVQPAPTPVKASMPETDKASVYNRSYCVVTSRSARAVKQMRRKAETAARNKRNAEIDEKAAAARAAAVLAAIAAQAANAHPAFPG